DAAARAELTAAAEGSNDPDLRYLARYLLGVIAQARGESATASMAFAAALEARPHSDAAALALAALELQRGDADQARARAREALPPGASDTDPWRQFLYGHYPQLPALIARLRAEVVR